MPKDIIIIQGAQYGSEAKGMVALALAERWGVDIAVRTGSINAGHTIVNSKGEKVAYQQLPTPAVLPGVKVVIGPGAYVNEATILQEMVNADCYGRTYIDKNCGVHSDDYTKEAAIARRNVKIGATGKGCAEAIVHKIEDRGTPNRSALFRDNVRNSMLADKVIYDTAEMLNDAYDGGEQILIEGTQGSLLDFHCGPYPYVTSRQCISAAWVAEAGLSPALQYYVVLVARTYPIRVAGKSGPMGVETSWVTIARRMNDRLAARGYNVAVPEAALDAFEKAMSVTYEEYKHLRKIGLQPYAATDCDQDQYELSKSTLAIMSLPPTFQAQVMKLFETTTVTKRLRRVAELDVRQLADTVRRERPDTFVLTFLNYVFPEIAVTGELHDEAINYIEAMEKEIKMPIDYVTIGPRSDDMLLWRSERYASISSLFTKRENRLLPTNQDRLDFDGAGGVG